jgi:hypothetical protein
MQGSSLAKRLADNWPLGLAVAVGLAFIPLANWLGVILALLLMLRQGGLWVSLGYALVSVIAYFTLTNHSLSLLAQEWEAIVMIFAPLGVMAWLLRGFRSLSLALAGGTILLMVLIVLVRLFQGPPSIDEWVTFFDCRMKASGLTEAQMSEFLPTGQGLKDAIQAFMIGWPLMISLLQMGLLFLTRWIQARAYYPGGFQRDFHSLKQPQSLALGAAGLLLIVTFAPDNMVTLLHLGILALVLMGITGLGTLHGYLAEKRRSKWWFVFVYGLMILNIWGALMACAILAVLDSCFNLNLREKVR